MYEIGTQIADMHYGTPENDYDGNPIKVTNIVEFRLDGSDYLLRSILKELGSAKHSMDNPYWKSHPDVTCVDNKYATVVGMDDWNNTYQAMWTWDNRYIGILEFEVLERTPIE
jgi:hypothetical protein